MTNMNQIKTLEHEKMDWVLKNANIIHIAIQDQPFPYILALSFGYHDNCIFFHGSLEGKKMDLLKKNPNIGFALEHAVAVKPAKKACKFSMRYASVIGSGTAVILEDLEEKSFGLNIVTAHYNAKPEQFSEAALSGLSVVRIDIHQMSYKETGLE